MTKSYETWYETVYLGDDSDCETCGGSYNQLNVHRNDDGTYDCIESVGCYGGDSVVDVSGEEALKFLEGFKNVKHIRKRITTENLA